MSIPKYIVVDSTAWGLLSYNICFWFAWSFNPSHLPLSIKIVIYVILPVVCGLTVTLSGCYFRRKNK